METATAEDRPASPVENAIQELDQAHMSLAAALVELANRTERALRMPYSPSLPQSDRVAKDVAEHSSLVQTLDHACNRVREMEVVVDHLLANLEI